MSRLSKLRKPSARKNLTLGGPGESFDGGQGFIQGRGLYGPYGMYGATMSYNGRQERIENDFRSYVERAYQANGIVFACILARALPFSEARFQYQRLTNGRPGDLFGGTGLSLLERPWPNGTTGEMLFGAEQDVSIAGNHYLTVVGTGATRRLRRLRPDWITIVSGVRGDPEASAFEIDAEVLGYIYKPLQGPTQKAVLLTPEQVVHWSPIPDPLAQWRGMSWLTPVLREIQSDSAATEHKARFYKNGASSGLVITYDKDIPPDLFRESVDLFDRDHQGTDNAWKTIHLGGGMDAKVMQTDLKSIDFKSVQGAGETRIAAAAGVGAIIARFSEGMQGSSLNAGNYGAAKRQFADMTLRPNWRSFAAAIEKFAEVPGGARLWPDTRDIAFLKEDEQTAAEILSQQATSIRTLTDAGFEPDSVIKAVAADDITLLKHSGLYSAQLLPPIVRRETETVTPDVTPAPLTPPQGGAP